MALYCAASLLAGAWGCAGYPPEISRYTPPQKEERYRVFFSREVPSDARPTDSADELAQKFVPGSAVKAAVDDFQKQGFTLSEISRVPWGEGATLFVFSRDTAEEPPLRSPINFVGTYRVEDDEAQPTYYIFNQTVDGYKIRVLGKGKIDTYEAKWEGRELVWETPEGLNHARLTPDGLTLYRIIQTASGFDVPRDYIILTAQRAIPPQKAESDDVRESRRYVIQLAPQTPRYYDPYPW